MQQIARSLALLLSAALFFVSAPVGAHEVELLAYSATPAADGSVQLILDFDGFAPTAQIVHAARNVVHVVIVGCERGRDLPGRISKVGVVQQGSIAPFAGVGLVLSLTLSDDVRPTVDSDGSRLVVHIPAPSSDGEAHLPSPIAQSAEGVKIIPLSYADVSEIAGLIKAGVNIPSTDVFSPQSPFAQPTPQANMGSSSSSSIPAAGAPTYVTMPTNALIPKDSPPGVYVDEHVSVDRRLNAVVLRGTPQEIAPYERLIALVDQPRRSVMLDTQIVELTESGAYDLGINYSSNGNLASATFNAGSGQKPTSTLSLSAQLAALATKGQAKILASPKILAADDRTAAILSGEAVPIFTNLLVPSGGTTIVQQQLQYINVGVSLEILPRIAANGDVTADIFSEVSSILSYVQTAPQIAVRQELTQAEVRDGQSLLIGGLLQDTEIKSYSKIPGIADIPLIGDLFKQTNITSQRTNLYLVITPHVLTSTSHAAQPPPGTQE
jgi:general secretion pathway protein D